MTTTAAIARVVSIATATATIETSATATLIATSLMAVLHVALIGSTLILAPRRLLWEFRLIGSGASNDTSAGLLPHMIWNRIIDLA